MALAFKAINTDIIRKLKWRSEPDNQTKWLTKVPYCRLVSFAVPKNDKNNDTQLRQLREKNVLMGGYLWDNVMSGRFAGAQPAPPTHHDYAFGNNSYRTANEHGIHKFGADGETKIKPTSRRLVPQPGVVQMSTQNKGSYGSLRGLNFQIKAFDLAQLELMEVLFMTPGVSVLAEWGWSYVGSTPSFISDIGETNFRDKDELQSQLTEKIKASKGDYDGCIATITNYNWDIQKDGSYNIQVDATSRGETMLTIPTNRSNSVLVDYIGRLVFDPDVYNVMVAQQEAGESASSNLNNFNVDTRAADKSRINLLRVPVWKYKFGETKLSKIRKEQRDFIEEQNDQKDKAIASKKSIAEQKKKCAQQMWYANVQQVMRLHRCQQILISEKSKNPSRGSAHSIILRNLSVAGQPTEGEFLAQVGSEGTGTSDNPNSGIGIFRVLTDWTQGHTFSNVGLWSLKHWPNDNSQYFLRAGYCAYYNWIAGHYPPKSTTSEQRKKISWADPNLDILSKGDVIWGKDGQGTVKAYRPAFISQPYFDGGPDPILGVQEEKQRYANVFYRPFDETYAVGDDGTKETGIHKMLEERRDDIPAWPGNSRIGKGISGLEKLLNKFNHSKVYSGMSKASDTDRMIQTLKRPYIAANNYDGGLGQNANEQYFAFEPPQAGGFEDLGPEYWSAPEGTETEDLSDPSKVLALDAEFWDTPTNFEESKDHTNTRMDFNYAIPKRDGNDIEARFSDGKTSEAMAPIDSWRAELPRLPVYVFSAKHTADTNDKRLKFGKAGKDLFEQPLVVSRDSPDGGKYFPMLMWYSYIDLQEWNTETGEFVYVEELKKKREEVKEAVTEALAQLESVISSTTKNVEKAKNYLNKLNRATGEYIPLWSLEYIFNNALNFSVDGKRIFRYDSGFLPYEEEKGDRRPPDISDRGEKIDILKEHAMLFDVIAPNLETPSDEEPLMSAEGFEVFEKFFIVTKDNNGSLLDGLWRPNTSLPVKVANHQELKSTNPMVCLFPGQETITPNAEFIKVQNYESRGTDADDEFFCDEMILLEYNSDPEKNGVPITSLPNPDLWVGKQMKRPSAAAFEDALVTDGDGFLIEPKKLWPNTFTECLRTDGVNLQDRFRNGYISNVLIHTDVLKKGLKLATSWDPNRQGQSGGQRIQQIGQYYQEILNSIQDCSGNMWDLNLQIDDKEDSTCRIVDLKYTKNIKVTGDTIWRFPLYGSDNAGAHSSKGQSIYDKNQRTHHIIRDFNIQSQIPNSMKAMAMYGNNASFVNQTTSEDAGGWNALSLRQKISWCDVSLEGIVYDSDRYVWSNAKGQMVLRDDVGLQKSDGSLIDSETLAMRGDVFNITANTAEAGIQAEQDARKEAGQVPITYEDQRTAYVESLTYVHDNGPTDEGGKHSRMAEKCLYAMLKHPLPITNQELDTLVEEANNQPNVDPNDQWTRAGIIKSKSEDQLQLENPNFFNSLIPLDCSITIDGISGIYFGNSFTLGGLPNRYTNTTAFQVTKVSHNIDTNGWQTTIQGQMRTIDPGAALKTDMIQDFTNVPTGEGVYVSDE